MRLVFALAAAVLAGCGTLAPPPANPPLAQIDGRYGYRFSNLKPGPDNSDGLFIVAAFSGGGTRSAALAYGVLEQLRDTTVQWEGRPRRLLDEIDVINGVSGGSYAAAYYGLHRDAFFPAFRERFLHADFQSELWDHYVSVKGVMQVLGWKRNDRVDRLSQLVDQRLFDGKTYGDLLANPTRPLIVIHATDLSLGSNFQFTQDQLDPLCTDLSALPIARAVAASSAVPILFGPVTLQNHAGRCGYLRPSWIKSLPADVADQTWAQRAQRRMQGFSSYLDASPASGRPWIHLIDGGVADNLGLRGPLESSIAWGGFAPLLQRLGVKGVRKVVFLVVSAEVMPNLKIDRNGDAPGTGEMAAAVVDAFMNHNSFEMMAWLRSSFRHWRQEAREQVGAPNSPYAGEPDFYLVDVQLRDVADPTLREKLLAVPTTLQLPPDQVESLVQAGHQLLEKSPEFQRLLGDLRR